jgi:hypothetical protein
MALKKLLFIRMQQRIFSGESEDLTVSSSRRSGSSPPSLESAEALSTRVFWSSRIRIRAHHPAPGQHCVADLYKRTGSLQVLVALLNCDSPRIGDTPGLTHGSTFASSSIARCARLASVTNATMEDLDTLALLIAGVGICSKPAGRGMESLVRFHYMMTQLSATRCMR